MAKKSKKSQSSKKSGSSKKKDNTLLWGIIALVIIVVVILLVRGGCETETPEEQQTTGPEEQQETEEETDTTELELEEVKCDESAAIGYKSCSMMDDGDVQFTILHQGGATLLGFEYYIYDNNGEIVGDDSEMQAVEGGAQATLTLPTSKFPNAERVEIRPLMTFKGEDSICKNQAVIQHVDRC